MARRTYTDDERAAGLAALALHGGNIKRAAREFGVPERTMRRWSEETPAAVGAIADQKKLDIADRLQRISERAAGCIGLALDAIEADRALAVDKLSDLNRIMGTAIDKHQLLTGGATSRVEQVIELDLGAHDGD